MDSLCNNFYKIFNSFVERPIQTSIKNKLTKKPEQYVSDEYIDNLIEKINNKDKSIAILFNIDEGVFKTDIFKDAEIVIAYSWDKSAVNYNLDKENFPNAKNIFMFSHPCEYTVPYRFKNWYLPHHSTTKHYFENHDTLILSDKQVDKICKAVVLKNHHTYTSYYVSGSDKNLRIEKY